MQSSVNVLSRSPGFTVAVCQNMALTIWHRSPTLPGVECAETASRMASAMGRPILASVLEHLHAPPPDNVRRALLHSLSALDNTPPRGATIIIEGSGLMLAGARGVVQGLVMAARPAYPMRVHASVDEAAAWFATLPEQDRRIAVAFRDLVSAARPSRVTAASA